MCRPTLQCKVTAPGRPPIHHCFRAHDRLLVQCVHPMTVASFRATVLAAGPDRNDSRFLVFRLCGTAWAATFAYKIYRLTDKSYNIKQCVRFASSLAPMIPKMRILIVDADNLLRDGLCALLSLESDLEVVGTLDSVEAIANIAPAILPEIVIMDIASPNSIGAGAIARIHERWPEARVVVLTMQQNDRVLGEALRAGAAAYALKSDSRQELSEALRKVAMGQRYVSPAMHGLEHAHASSDRHQADGLTDRERDVMRHIARGRRTREIAQELSLSHKTIEKHRSSLMRKLGLKTATAVAAYAISNGYLED